MIVKFLIVLCLVFATTLCARISSGEISEDLPPSSPEKPPISLSEKIKAVNAALLKYDRELDRMVPFKEIREALQGLDIMARNYTGNSIQDITRASHSGYQATDNYFRATDKIVEWCAKADTIFNYLIDNEYELDQELIEKGVKKILKEGLEVFKSSIKTLETVVDQLSEMEKALRPVPDNLNKELKEMQLMNAHAVGKLRGKKLKINTALTMLGMLVGFVLSIYLGPIGGGIIGLGIRMMLVAIPTAVIEGRMVPSMDQKLKIAEAYYMTVIQTVEHSQANVTNVRNALHTRLNFMDIDLRTDQVQIQVRRNEEQDQMKVRRNEEEDQMKVRRNEEQDQMKVRRNDQDQMKVRRNEQEGALIMKELRRFMPTLREMLSRHLPDSSPQPRTGRYHHPTDQTPLYEKHFLQSSWREDSLRW